MSERSLIRDADRRISKAKREGAVELDLSGLELRNLPYALHQLTQLQSLNLSNNRLTTLLNSLGRLTQLQSLDLHNNRLTALPHFLGRLTQLHSLDLRNNALSDPPPEVIEQGTEAVLAYLRAAAENRPSPSK
jgi:Leucine-rich repeat (LRR) protein